MKKMRLFLVTISLSLGVLSTSASAQELLWGYIPAGGYSNAFTYKAANGHCVKHGGTMASKTKLLAAQEKGFSMCAAGWLQGGLAGYVMVGAHKGCGRDGFNSWGSPSTDKTLTAYCVGATAPSHASKSIVLLKTSLSNPSFASKKQTERLQTDYYQPKEQLEEKAQQPSGAQPGT